MSSIKLREGFAGQDMFVIPRPILAEASHHALIRSVYPTDIGWFPRAEHHYRHRPQGAAQDHLMLCIDGHGYAVIDGKEAHLQAGEQDEQRQSRHFERVHKAEQQEIEISEHGREIPFHRFQRRPLTARS